MNIDHSIVGLESLPQLQVDFALNIHKKKSSSEANGHDHQLSPKGPLQYACCLSLLDLLGSAVNEHIQGPDYASDGDDVECHRTHDLPTLTG